jgi:hypothetical protein
MEQQQPGGGVTGMDRGQGTGAYERVADCGGLQNPDAAGCGRQLPSPREGSCQYGRNTPESAIQ